MKWFRDNTGRFRERPHYETDELESICEESICSFLRERHGKVVFPVSTADLTVLIEQAVDDLDSSCELEDGVDGFTDFFPRKRPKVKISSRLQERHLENRLRTTLTHEFGHVRLHGFLFAMDDDLQRLFDDKPKDARSRCHRDTTITGGRGDWMEWQAGFACGALLMPLTHLARVVRTFREQNAMPFADIGVDTDAGRALIEEVMAEFQVSSEAARVRMEQRNIIVAVARPGLI